MRISIRYFRPMATGNFTTITFDDVNHDKNTVIQLKRKIFAKLKLET
jgi:hypothetical protein